MYEVYYWYGLFVVLFLAYLYIQHTVKSKKKYFFYFLSGSLIGFYFDIISYTMGYYTYPDFFMITILGIPFSMMLAEGFSVAIAIYLFEIILKVLRSE